MPSENGLACFLLDSRFASVVSVVHSELHERYLSRYSGACEGELKIGSAEWLNEIEGATFENEQLTWNA